MALKRRTSGGRAAQSLVLATLVWSAGQRLDAHHSLAAFETSTRVTVAGKVAALDWGNPHVIVEIDGAEDNGGVRRWTVELASPTVLARAGWKSSDLKYGDSVSVVVNPLKNGDAGGLLVQATLADGRVLEGGSASRSL